MNERGGDANGRGAVAEKTSEPPPSKVEALDGSNYEEWSGRMRSAFKRYKLLKIAVGEEKMPEEGEARERWIEKSTVLFDLILQSVNKEMFEHIKDLVEADDSGPRAWKLLRDIKYVAAASGALLPVIGVGNAKVKGANGELVGLGNVLLVKGLSANLLSVRRLQKSKAEVTFGPTSCRAKLGKKVLWSLEEETSCIKDLWQLPIIPWNGKTPTAATAAAAKATAGGDATAPTDGVLEAVKKVQQQQRHGEVLAGVDASAAWAKASSKSGEADWETWHERLCHVNFPMLQKLVKDGSLKGLEVKGGVKEIGSCPTCLETKFSKFPFNSTTGPAKTPLALVHMDVVGPTRAPSLSGSRYFLTIVDDHTRAADELQQPSRQVEVAVSEEEMSGVTEEGGAAEVEQQQQQHESPPRVPHPPERPRRDVRPPVRLTYGGRGKPNVVQAGSVVEQIEEDEIAHCYWAPIPEPKTREEALNGPNGEKWKASEDEEFGSLIENETWDLCDLPPGKKAITSKMIYRHKYGPEGELTRYKSRLVARGFQQTKGKDYDEVFAPVGKGTTLRVLLAIAALLGWKIRQMDIVTAFLNGIILEEVYMKQPEGLDDGSGRVCRLKKAIYGLKQAPRAWYHKLEEALLAGGFKKSECDPSLFLLQEKDEILMLLVYVDDILLFSASTALLDSAEQMLEMQFKCSKME
ncbi:hypothetical protein CLOP_g10831 [Closterium sp. NIES-67]|nr:hypothetical protein CLOP_g10831 [Closterium sp. NIES-67]